MNRMLVVGVAVVAGVFSLAVFSGEQRAVAGANARAACCGAMQGGHGSGIRARRGCFGRAACRGRSRRLFRRYAGSAGAMVQKGAVQESGAVQDSGATQQADPAQQADVAQQADMAQKSGAVQKSGAAQQASAATRNRAPLVFRRLRFR